MKIIERLETLRKLNRNPEWINDNIFRLVCSPQMAVLAYEQIKSKPGNMTVGDDGVTLDHISLEAIGTLCESIKNGSYSPKPVRRKFIPKANGKSRPLGSKRLANSPCVSVSQAARVAVSHAERLPCITS